MKCENTRRNAEFFPGMSSQKTQTTSACTCAQKARPGRSPASKSRSRPFSPRIWTSLPSSSSPSASRKNLVKGTLTTFSGTGGEEPTLNDIQLNKFIYIVCFTINSWVGEGFGEILLKLGLETAIRTLRSIRKYRHGFNILFEMVLWVETTASK